MKKRKKILIIVASILAVLAVGVFVAYRYVSDYIFSTVLEAQFTSMFENGEISQDSLLGVQEEHGAQNEGEPSKAVSGQVDLADGDNGEADESQRNPQSSKEKKQATQQEKEAISKKVEDVKKNTTASERSEIMKMVMSKLSSSDIAYLQGLASDGISSEDMQAAKTLAYSRFSASEIQKLKDYYYKYFK